MALSYFTESEAPRDFRISSTESESHYTKCLLCYTIKKNFYCVDCIKAGNFLHSTMPYSDRFADKQAKLLRLRANRKHVQDRCEALLLKKSKHDSLQIEVKQCRDKVELIKLAIEQRRSNIEERKKALTAVKNHNTELGLKLPRYQKRVSSLASHALQQKTELSNRVSLFNESAESLGSLRRARIRQLTKYIFPVYITYDSSDSVEDMEFLQVETEESPLSRERLHVVAAWLPVDGDYSFLHRSMSVSAGLPAGEACGAAGRARAALALAAQLTELLAWITDVHLINPLPFSEVCLSRLEGVEQASELEGWARRLCGAVVSLGLRAALPPPPLARHALACLHGLAVAAATDDPMLGRVSGHTSLSLAALGEAWAAAWPAPPALSWTDTMHVCTMEELSSSPPQPPPSLVTSAAASLASFLRGWTK
ncbi:hypothetical protein JYU34_002988 [Plutella xylostella]|uniref:Beclin 1-associated autophagy-related key regulator n=1 Tax=Plutella xylostella TaxID=51655 RepID=A0ABQ7R3M0_PLUXY|nr:beclin 1-associated autophagy-related key regulator [Plutella xylostella]KAG7311903.1 hypothetical protein JYU34_002988 [Plutella xylostella]